MTKVDIVLVVLLWINYTFSFTIKDWGESCTNSDECFDPRMVCVPDENNITKCDCDRFHVWNQNTTDCIQIYSAEYMMNQTVTVHDNQARMERLQDMMFRGPMYSIYFMMFVIATATVSVVIYCLYVRTKDGRLRNILVQMHAENKQLKGRRTAFQHSSTSRC